MPTRPLLTEDEDQAREVLNHLSRLRGFTDARIAARAGMTRGTVQGKRSGITRIGIADAAKLAKALDVEPIVFFMTPDDAIRWVLDNRPEWRTPGCFTAVESLVRKLTDRAENHPGVGLCPAA